MRPDELYIRDILEAVEAIEDIVRGLQFEQFAESRRNRSAVLHEITVIGEAAGRVSVELREQYPHVPWRYMSDTRNVIVHGYFGLEWPRIWQTVTRNIPPLKFQMQQIIANEFSG